MLRRTLVLGTALALALVSNARADESSEKRTCANAYLQAQQLRRAGKLVLSRAQVGMCETSCPGALADDCRRWHVELDSLLPSVVVDVRDDAGAFANGVTVAIDDDAPLADAQRREVDLDPGEHVLRVSAAGMSPRTERVSVLAGQRRRIVSVVLARAPGASNSTAAASNSHAREEKDEHEHVPVPALVLVGIGGLGVALGGVLGIKGQLDKSSLQESCAPRCSEDQVQSIRTEWTSGGVAAAAGALALGTGLLWILLSPPAARHASQSQGASSMLRAVW